MSLRLGSAFLSLSVLNALLSIISWDDSFPLLGIAFLYVAFSFSLLATAYLSVGVKLLGKAQSGRQSFISLLILGPYFWISALTLRSYCIAGGEVEYAAVRPNLCFGRRLSATEAKQAITSHGWVGVLDLAAEFAEVDELRLLPGYRSLPILDGTAPTLEELKDAVVWLRQQTSLGPVYVHCALGHGRSACIVVAYLIANNEVDTAENGVTRLRELRTGVALNAAQMKMVKRYQQECDSPA